MSTAYTSPTTNKAVKIFGREPAAWVGLIEGILVLLMAFAIGVNQETFGPIMAVITAAAGVYTAWVTTDTMLGVIVGFAKATLTLFAVYGLTLSDEQTGAIIGVVALVVGFFQRTQTSPVIGGAPHAALVKVDGRALADIVRHGRAQGDRPHDDNLRA